MLFANSIINIQSTNEWFKRLKVNSWLNDDNPRNRNGGFH
jgi:hypothetical protein